MIRSKISTTPARLDFQAGLFQDLAAHALFQRLAGFEHAAGQRPISLQRGLAALTSRMRSRSRMMRPRPGSGRVGYAADRAP